ncbi:phosphotransferase [Rhodalgimonas zhirmunskyi]|uniref:Phosphotransferase n=1 Tax=Rhodalgimonas zhirmunskyi TaxID=2964767 RepID=A0AAJ1U942_9RHOB|nr:phosphotransferase [Rhodoalgimonas zhirmunskyi]MDQ2095875.1 phosphotransferase [Rhodoalgimonas zhirmunskyi]
MDNLAREAAASWGLSDAQITLAARRENVVYRVEGPDATYALRLHRPGYRCAAELTSELDWMAALAAGGVSVPAPIATSDGGWTVEVGGHVVDLLQWMEGASLGAAGELQGITDRSGFCRILGQEVARMHDISDGWARPEGFSRPAWDRVGLLGEAPIWGRFWEHPDLSAQERALLEDARDQADIALTGVGDADYGLIHADILAENMLWDGRRLTFIDFDDGGFGYRDFELATFLLRYVEAPDYPALRAALIEGYAGRRVVNEAELDLFLLLRALTYPGWIMARLGEPGAKARSERAVRVALGQAREWMERYGRAA